MSKLPTTTDDPLQNEVNLLMERDPLDLAKDPEAVDKLILFYRRERAKMKEGIKPLKARKAESGVKLDLVALGFKTPPTIGIKRRV